MSVSRITLAHAREMRQKYQAMLDGGSNMSPTHAGRIRKNRDTCDYLIQFRRRRGIARRSELRFYARFVAPLIPGSG